MAESTKENGRIIKCMERASTYGGMAKNMMEIMLMGKNMGLEYMSGKVDEST